MATVSYHLRDPKADAPTPIYMMLYADYNQTKAKTGLRIHPSQWDAQAQRAKTRGRGISSTNGETNDDLVAMGKRATDFYGQQRSLGRLPTGAEIWEAIRPRIGTEEPAPVAEVPMPLPDFEAYIESLKAKSSHSTIKAKRTTLGHLRTFSERFPTPLAYTDFTLDFKTKFAAYLADEVGLADNTLAKVLSILKGFLSHAADVGRTPRIEVRGWGWKYKEPEIIALTAGELAAIEALTGLPGYLENARSLFLLMCYTGLRYSDAMRLLPEHDKSDHLYLVAKKTGDAVTVYIRKNLRPILNKYWAGELRLITNQRLNDYIKELGERAGVEAPTQITRHYGQTSKPKQETYPKYKLLGCHSGRRTFVTLSIGRDVPTDVVMQATGHKNHRTVQRYNQTSIERQVAASRRAWGEDED
jgi:integrase